jgi:serine/threonine protein kinase/tetratricopeptide (TPR) repeat protein
MEGDSTPSLDGGPQVIAGRYEVLGLLGVGGMGAVYKVRDRELDDVVALKMLKREIARSPGIVERFRREVKLARRVTHPNVARTFDLGEHAGDRFLTMELVDGESLATRLAREGCLSVADVVSVVSAICQGLDAAHAAGVVHRDLKPDNVLLARATGGGARVVITDFGVARAQEAGAAARTGIPIGTPAYMAPEQVEASPDIDARADIYALGAIMFELLTGRLPFEADSVFAVAAMRLMSPPPDPRRHRPDVPESLSLFVQKCMARKPADRPQSAREVAARLASITLPTGDAVPPRNDARPAAVVLSTDPSQKTVAVLPFRNGGESEHDYLVDGLTDDIIDALSVTPGLRVRPRGVVMQHKDAAGDPRELGRELGVQVVIEGTVRVTGDAIRVNARVMSVDDGFQIWAKRFEGKRADVLRIGDEAARAIANALTARTPTRAALVTDPVALDLYLRGRHEFLKFWSDANERAVGLLGSAHERAPDDPLVMAAYAGALARQFGMANAADRSDRARLVAEEAVRLAPKLAEAHLALANVRLHEPDPVAVAAGVTRALSLSPLLPDAHELRARLLSEVGPPREAIEAAGRAMQLEPRLRHLRYDVQARARFVLGEWDLADFGEPPEDKDSALLYWVMVGRMTMWTRDRAAGAALAKTLGALEVGSAPLVQALASVVGDARLPDAFRAHVQSQATSDRLTPRMRAFWNQLNAELHGYVGEPAIDDVKTAVEIGLFDIVWLDACPLLEPLRDHPEFPALRAKVAARAAATAAQLHATDATLAS